MKVVIVVASLLFACGKGKGGTVGDDCAPAVARAMELQAAALSAERREQNAAMNAKLEDAVVASCRATKWSRETMDCLKRLKTLDEGVKCKLTPEQQSAKDKATGEVVRAMERDAARDAGPQLRDRMCACKDTTCVGKVDALWVSNKNTADLATADELTKDAGKRLEDQYTKCKAELE